MGEEMIETFSFTMPNEGFRYVNHFSKAVLIIARYDEYGRTEIIKVIGIPLTAIRMLENQNIFHFRRAEVHEYLLIAIDEFEKDRVHRLMEKVHQHVTREIPPRPFRVQ